MPEGWLTPEEWAERQGIKVTSVRQYINRGRIKMKLFTSKEAYGHGGMKMVPMIHESVTGNLPRKKPKAKPLKDDPAKQKKMQQGRRRAAAERHKKFVQRHRELDPIPFLGWVLSRPENDVELCRGAGYADDRTLAALWTGHRETVRFEYVEKVLGAYGRTVKSVYKDLK